MNGVDFSLSMTIKYYKRKVWIETDLGRFDFGPWILIEGLSLTRKT